MKSIADTIKNAIAFDLKNRSKTIVDEATIALIFSLLEARSINYLLVGGVAMLCYVEGRNTQDIDFLLNPSDLDRIPELVVSSRDGSFARADFCGLQIDLLLTSNPVFSYALEQYGNTNGNTSFAQTWAIAPVGETRINCIQPEGLIFLKLYALPSLYRQGSFQRANLYEGDITALLIEFPDLDQCLEPLFVRLAESLIASDIAALREIIDDIRQRIIRMRR